MGMREGAGMMGALARCGHATDYEFGCNNNTCRACQRLRDFRENTDGCCCCCGCDRPWGRAENAGAQPEPRT